MLSEEPVRIILELNTHNFLPHAHVIRRRSFNLHQGAGYQLLPIVEKTPPKKGPRPILWSGGTRRIEPEPGGSAVGHQMTCTTRLQHYYPYHHLPPGSYMRLALESWFQNVPIPQISVRSHSKRRPPTRPAARSVLPELKGASESQRSRGSTQTPTPRRIHAETMPFQAW